MSSRREGGIVHMRQRSAVTSVTTVVGRRGENRDALSPSARIVADASTSFVASEADVVLGAAHVANIRSQGPEPNSEGGIPAVGSRHLRVPEIGFCGGSCDCAGVNGAIVCVRSPCGLCLPRHPGKSRVSSLEE